MTQIERVSDSTHYRGDAYLKQNYFPYTDSVSYMSIRDNEQLKSLRNSYSVGMWKIKKLKN